MEDTETSAPIMYLLYLSAVIENEKGVEFRIFPRSKIIDLNVKNLPRKIEEAEKNPDNDGGW